MKIYLDSVTDIAKSVSGKGAGMAYSYGMSIFYRRVGIPVLMVLTDYLDRKND